MTPRTSHGIEYANPKDTAAKLRGIARSFEESPARPVEPDMIAYVLHLYGAAIQLGLETLPVVRRWAETLSAETLRQALGEAVLSDAEFRVSISYHEGVRRSEWHPCVLLAVIRATMRALLRDPESEHGVLHVECLAERARR